MRYTGLTKILSAVLVGVLSLTVHAAPEEKVAADGSADSIVKAAEELALYSQSIVKDYFYIQQNLNTNMAKSELNKRLLLVNENFNYLSGQSQKYPELEGLLRFLSITLDDFKEAIEQPYSDDNASLMLDMSDVILEGAENIKNTFNKEKGTRNEMLHVLEYQSFLVERMTKLYIASHVGFKDFNTFAQVESAVAEFEEGMKKIEAQNYPSQLQTYVAKLRDRWDLSKVFYIEIEKTELPQTVFYSTAIIDRYLNKLIEYEAGNK